MFVKAFFPPSTPVHGLAAVSARVTAQRNTNTASCVSVAIPEGGGDESCRMGLWIRLGASLI